MGRLTWVITLVWLMPFVCFAQGVTAEQEALKILNHLKVYEAMRGAGLDTPEARYAESVHADAFDSLLKKNNHLNINFEIMRAWFQLQVSSGPRFERLAKEFNGMVVVFMGKETTAVLAMSEMGFLDTLERLLGTTDQERLAEWIKNEFKNWVVDRRKQLSSENPEIRKKALQYFFANRGDFGFLEKLGNQIISKLSIEEKIRLVTDLKDHPDSRVRQFFFPWFIKSIPYNVWYSRYSHLFSQLIYSLQGSVQGADRVVQWLATKPKVARSNISLAKVLGTDITYYDFKGKGFNLIEQLMIVSPMYQQSILNHFFSGKHPWAIELIPFIFEHSLHRTEALAILLTKPVVADDPRWFDWVGELKAPMCRRRVNFFVTLDVLYTTSTDKAFNVQKLIFEDAILAAKDGNPIALKNFIEKSSRNIRLLIQMNDSWGKEIFEVDRWSTRRALVDNVMFSDLINHETRFQWLEIILKKGVTDLQVLEKLIEGFGVHPELMEDYLRTQGHEADRIEIIRASLLETLIDQKTPFKGISCRKVFHSL